MPPKKQVKNSKKRAVEQAESEAPAKKPKLSDDAIKNKLVTPQLPQQPYHLSAPAPTRARKTREFEFKDVPQGYSFRPNCSPEEMIRRGVFGGSYFRPLYSKHLKAEFHDDWSDLPKEWYEGLDVDRYLLQPEYDPSVNCWPVKVGQSIEEWEAQGWIDHSHDIRGWFQWYCRFFLGRRCDDDARQIQRWAGVAGRTGRFRRTILGKYVQARQLEVDPIKEDVSPGIRQTLLHWALDVTTAHLNEYKEDKGIRVPNVGDSQDEDSGGEGPEDDAE